MRTIISLGLIAILVATGPTPLVAADEPPALTHNPFSRPSSEVVRVERGIIESNDGSGLLIPLQATMVGSVNRLANVAGRILKPGDDYQGYQLVEIQEQYAVFERDGQSRTVYVKPLLAENEEYDESVER